MYQKQKGATMWQWLFVGGMVAIFIYVGLMLTPVYMEGMSVKQALMKLKASGASLTKSEVTTRIMKQFQLDQVTRAKKEDIKFRTLRDGRMEVSIEYDVKVHMTGNLFLLVEFRPKVQL